MQLANPKAAVFLMAFYPQFVPAGQPLFTAPAALALLQVTLGTMLYLGLAAGVARAGAWFRRPRVRQRLGWSAARCSSRSASGSRPAAPDPPPPPDRQDGASIR